VSTKPSASVRGALILIPTYNEAENIGELVARTLTSLPAAHVRVIDDNSPDGTGLLVDRLAGKDSRISVDHRQTRLGIGPAYLAGFSFAIRAGYDVIVQMDADGSHPPESLPGMLAELDRSGAGLVIGSRWTKGGSVVDWPYSRELLSRAANAYAQLALGIGVADSTAGFRAYRATALREIDLAGVDSQGYCFQIDLTVRMLAAGFAVREVPIVFRDRTHGESKMSGGIVIEAMTRVTGWGIGRRASQLKRLLPRPVV
jgi:dolichol-phosphate mannosyltransferase